MTSIVNDDGSLHVTITGDNQVLLNPRIKEYIYQASDFPVWACKFKGLDDIYDSAGLWYCAGEVTAAQNDSMTSFSWYEAEEVGDGWMVVTVDLDGAARWEGEINSFRLDIDATTEHGGEEFDLAWIGFFRSEEEAYAYAGVKQTTDTTTNEDTSTPSGDTTDNVTTPSDDTTKADDTTEAKTDAPTTKAPETTTNSGSQGGPNTGVIIAIVVAAVVAIAAVVAVVVLKKKKK